MGEKKKAASADRKALYRRYRSKSLGEIVGQEHVTTTLENAIKQGKISHAYLLTGPRGTGKTSIARIIAHTINDLPYEDESTNLDIVEIDAASNRRIDDIRDLRDKVHIAPVSAKYKVYIIDEVHMLTTESFNALLKTLEEPPAHVVFILATTEVHKLPATIISRTQRHSLRLIPTEKITEHLAAIANKEGIDIDKAALEILATHGEGSFRDSISLLDQMSASSEPITAELVELALGLAPKDILQALLSAAKAGDGSVIFENIRQLESAGLTPGGIALQLLELLREDARGGSHDQQSVNLMEQLLSVQNAQYPQLKLETILLGVHPPTAQKTPTQSSRNSDGKTTKTDEPDIKQPEEPKKAAKENIETANVAIAEQAATEEVVAPKSAEKTEDAEAKKSTSNQSGSVIEKWQEVLEATKTKNNPLYTVLRLATPEVEQSELVLVFAFPFHKKKVEESRYKALIAEVVAEITGETFEIQARVDKTKSAAATINTPQEPDPAHASLISSVQDIMGGGEVVHV